MDRLASLAVSLAALASAPAAASPVEEVRLGVMAHNICVSDCDNANKEDGPNLSGDLVFDTPGLIEFALKPRPFLTASANLSGDTSWAGGGLLWTFPVARKWSVEPGLAYVVHDGELEPPFPQGDQRNAPFDQDTVYLGSRDLFRLSFAVNRDLTPRWGAQIQYEHLSHGQILGDGRNQGMDTLGVRLYRRFGR